MSATIRVGILGLGTVGMGVVDLLSRNRDAISAKTGMTFEVVAASARTLSAERKALPFTVTDNPHQVVTNPEVDILVEVMGGLEPARELIASALKNGTPVATANKAVMAKHGDLFLSLAHEGLTAIRYEACVGAGIPILGPLRTQLAGNAIQSIQGIVNGTTNYLLSRMEQEQAELSPLLSDAQRLGYAEADPSADVDGLDAQSKLALLCAEAWGQLPEVDSIERTGIMGVTLEQILRAKQEGFRFKLIAEARKTESAIVAGVGVRAVPESSPFFDIMGTTNAVWVEGDPIGRVGVVGPGAGGGSTASGVVGDIIELGRALKTGFYPQKTWTRVKAESLSQRPSRHLVFSETEIRLAEPDENSGTGTQYRILELG